MQHELERKWLISYDADEAFIAALAELKNGPHVRLKLKQGYLHETKPTTRVRLNKNVSAHLCIKGTKTKLGAPEYEYEIPYEDGLELYRMCESQSRVIKKNRYLIPFGKVTIELDVFTTPAFYGLIVAEIEKPENMTYEDFNNLEIPKGFGPELTGLKGWSNFAMAKSKTKPPKP